MLKAEGGIFTFSSSTANNGTPMHLDISSLDLFFLDAHYHTQTNYQLPYCLKS